MFRIIIVAAVLILVGGALTAEPPSPIGQLEAYARMPLTLGHPEQGYGELYEFDMWLCETGLSEAHVRRCGAPPYRATTHNGYCPFEVVPGRYAVLLHQPEWFIRPAVVPDIAIDAGSKAERNIMPSLDYAMTTSGGKLAPWQKEGGPNPWTSANVFYQTFVARGTSITHAHFKPAGAKATSARISIHKVREGSPPDAWERVGSERIDPQIGALGDSWVGWRSGEVPTTPGQLYAVKIEGLSDGSPAGIAMLIHRDDVGPGYDDGTAWADGVEQKYDIYGTVSSDSAGTVIPYMRVYDIKPGKLAGWGKWSQTWVAQGKSLAAADLLVAWTEKMNGVPAEVRVREDGPTGRIIGVSKRTHTAWWGPGHGFLGAAWFPGEVPLEPGKTYCMEWEAVPPADGYSASVVNHPKNAYPDGMAFRDGKAMPDDDLEMTVMEYKACPAVPAPKPPYEPKGKSLLLNGGFEAGVPNEADAQDPYGWTRWNAGVTAYWYGKYGRNGSNAARVIGGNINDTRIDGGYVQRVAGLSAKKDYCLSGWTAGSAQTDLRYLSAVGYDPTGQVTDPKADTIVWKLTGRHSFLFEQAVFSGVKPEKDAISVWTRGANKDVGNLIFTVDFDDLALVEELGG